MNVPVTIIVKASNQQFEDQTINCEISWSIRKLKEYLSEVYPCKPIPEEQKLIYSGQLLNDTTILKDILRQYDEQVEGNQIHTVHLVYNTTKIKPKLPTTIKENTQSATTTDGLRQRNVNNSASVSSTTPTATLNNIIINDRQINNQPIRSTQQNLINQNISMTANCNNNNNNNNNGMGNFLNGANMMGINPQLNTNVAAQQMAMQHWLQYTYAQYLNQYMNFLQLGIPPETMYVTQANVNMPGMTPFYTPNSPVISPLSPSSAPIVSPLSNTQTPQPAAADGAQAVPQQPQQQLAEQNLENRPQPRFPNIVHEEVPENRDWLDMIYTLSRLMIFLTLVYFYSSPMRCLIVVFIAVALYLYHVGFFRNNLPEANNIRQLNQQIMNNNNNNNNNNVVEENNNNNNNNNNNIDAAEPNQRVVDQVDGVVAAGAAPNRPNNVNEAANQRVNGDDTNENPSGVVVDENESRSILSFIRSFVVSFFISLVPETPAL